MTRWGREQLGRWKVVMEALGTLDQTLLEAATVLVAVLDQARMASMLRAIALEKAQRNFASLPPLPDSPCGRAEEGYI